jgi:DNA ligase-1
MLFARVVETSERVADTSRRLEKIELLATLLKQLNSDESEIAVAFLSGYTRQGKIGVGYATIRAAESPASGSATLEIVDVDREFTALAAIKGRGAEGQRRPSSVFSRPCCSARYARARSKA